jgi:hypothetical protein
MRRLMTITLAVLLAALSTGAMAGGRYGYYDYDRDDDGAYLAGGLLLGLAAGAAIANSDDRYYDRYDYRYDRRFDRRFDRRYSAGFRGGYGYRPYYQPDVVIYRDRPRHRRGYYYAPPRRVVYDNYYYDRGYRRW